MEIFTPGHLVVIAVVALVLFFGWKQLPDMARSVGRSLRVFKTEIKGMNEDDKARESAKELEAREADERPAPSPAPAPQPAHAEVLRNPAAAPTPEPARARPRPTPSPNGRANAR